MLEFPVSVLLALLTCCVGWLIRNVRIPNWLLIGMLCAEFVVVALMGTFAWGWLKVPLIVFTVPLMLLSFAETFRHITTKNFTSVLVHGGLAVVFCAAMCGSADVERGQVILYKGKLQRQAYTQGGGIMALPFAMELERFETDYYEDGVSPKMYRSRLKVNGEHLVTEVNAPAHYKGYALFQAGYDAEENAYSVIEVVRDPWLPLVFVGMAMLMAGAVLTMVRCWHSWKAWVFITVVALVFAMASVAKINFGMLVPALRNWLFVPHLIIYMLAYAIIAIVLILNFVPSMRRFAHPLMTTASQLLIIGMLFGAVWARMAWGDYWTWDAKECWAAATWMASLGYLHLPEAQRRVRVAMIVLTFAALQVTWYGVNHLPAARASMHTYNN